MHRRPHAPPCRLARCSLSSAAFAAGLSIAASFAQSPPDRPVTPFEFGARIEQCDGATDISGAVQAALDSGRNVYIPATPKPCVVGDVTMSRADQTLYSENGLLAPKPGADVLVRVQGWASRLHGFNIEDNGGVVRQMALAAPAGKGDPRVGVTAPADGKAPKAGQRFALRLDGGSLFTTWVTGVSGNGPYTLELRDPLASPAKAGAEAWATFGLIHVSEASQCVIRDLVMTRVWGGILLDDPKPEKYAGVDRCTVDTATMNGVRMFAVVKGRNVANSTLENIKAYGGWTVSASFAGDGASAKFRLPYPLYLRRELHVSVDNKPVALGKDYDIGPDGGFSWKAPAPPGSRVQVRYQTYGADGYVEDGRDSITATGGNFVRNVAFLQFQRCGLLLGAQLYDVGGIFDTCSEAALKVEATIQMGQLADVFAGWAPKALWIAGGAQGVKALGVVVNATPKGYQADGGEGVNLVIEKGSSLDGTVFSARGSQVFVNSQPAAATPASPQKSTAAAETGGATALFLFGDTGLSTIAAGARTLLGPSGVTFDGGWVMPSACVVKSAKFTVDKQAGPGQRHQLQLSLNGGKVDGAAAELAGDRFSVEIPAADLNAPAGATLTIEDMTSSRAVPAHARYGLQVVCQSH